MVGHGAGADKRDVCDVWVRGQVLCDIGPAVYRLHDVRGVSAGYERRGCDGGEVEGGPGGGLGAFHYYGVAGKDGGYDGGDEVVELCTLVSISQSKRWGAAYGITVRC